jgi:hypothetical protein
MKKAERFSRSGFFNRVHLKIRESGFAGQPDKK